MDVKSARHLVAMFFLAVCATGYLFDVLFLDKHLSAFDIFLEKPSWKVELGDVRAHNKILSDSPTAHYPYKREFWDATRQGYNTQYLPHIFTGKPTSGQGVGIFSTSLFQLFMDIPNAMDWSAWFRLFLAAALMYVLLIQLGTGSAAATLGGIAWAYNLHQIAWLMFPHHLATELWLPLLLSLNLMILKDRSNLAASLGLVLSVLYFFTSGYTQIILYTFIFIGVFNTLYVLIAQRGTFKEKIKSWCYIHAIYMIAALALLPEALWQSQEIAEGLRGEQGFRYSSHELKLSFGAVGSLISDMLPNAIEVTRLLMPNYQSPLGEAANVKQFFSSNPVEFQAYFGLACLYFLLYGLVKGVVRRDRLLTVFAMVLFLSIGLFNGNRTLVALLNLIPFGGAGAYSRMITLVLLFAVIFAAHGAKYFAEDMRQRRYLILFIPLMLIAIWLGAAKYQNTNVLALREFAPWIAGLIGFLFLCALLGRFGKASIIVPMVVGVSFAELAVAGYNFNTRLHSEYHFPENTVIKKIRSTPGDFRTALLLNNTAYHHNILTYYDLSTVGGYSTIAPNDYLYFMRHAYKKIHVTLNGILFLFDGNLEILRLLNTRYIVSNLDLKSDLIKPVFHNNAETLYEFTEPLGRAYCASHQFVNKDRKAIPRDLARLARQYDRPVVVTKPLLGEEALTSGCKVSETKVFTSKLVFKVDADRPSIVFVPVNYHQYWRASIEGEAVPIHRANYSFMGIVVPPGTSQVALEFINMKLTWGAVLFIILGLAIMVVAILKVRGNWPRTVIILAAGLMVGKSLMSIPGIMNMDIPERMVSDAQAGQELATRRLSGGPDWKMTKRSATDHSCRNALSE